MRFPFALYVLPCGCTVEGDMMSICSLYVLRAEEDDAHPVRDFVGALDFGVVECPWCDSTCAAGEFVEWVRDNERVHVNRPPFAVMRFDGELLEIVDVWKDGPMVRPRGSTERPTHLVMDLAELDVLRN